MRYDVAHRRAGERGERRGVAEDQLPQHVVPLPCAGDSLDGNVERFRRRLESPPPAAARLVAAAYPTGERANPLAAVVAALVVVPLEAPALAKVCPEPAPARRAERRASHFEEFKREKED